MNEDWDYTKLIEHLRTSFKSGKTFSSLLLYFYGQCQKPRETKDQFTNELPILARKVKSVYPEWRSHVDEALKTQFAHRLQDQYLTAMAHNLLKAAPVDITITGVLGRVHNGIQDKV